MFIVFRQLRLFSHIRGKEVLKSVSERLID
jgi:hypothetical protein